MLVLSGIGLIILGILWIFADPRPIRKRFSDNILRSYILLLLVIIPQILSFIYFPIPAGNLDQLIIPLGFVLFSIGLSIDLWARFTMARYWGPPGQHDTKRQTKLITSGPFAYTRNPIYIGTFLLLTGFSLILKSIFFFLPIVLLIYFTKQVKVEEKLLTKKFGKDYDDYKKITPRFL